MLELATDDLDYMNIRVLAHRKTILKEVARLRGVTPSMTTFKPLETHESQSSVGERKEPKEKTKLVHWSQTKPLAENQVQLESIFCSNFSSL